MAERRNIGKNHHDNGVPDIERKTGAQDSKHSIHKSDCDVVDLTRVSEGQTNPRSKSRANMARLNEIKKQRAAKELERLVILSDASDRQWQNPDASNSRLREIFRQDRKQQRKTEQNSPDKAQGRMGIPKYALTTSPNGVVQIGSRDNSKRGAFDDSASKAKQARISEYVKRKDKNDTGLAILAETYGLPSSDDSQSEPE